MGNLQVKSQATQTINVVSETSASTSNAIASGITGDGRNVTASLQVAQATIQDFINPDDSVCTDREPANPISKYRITIKNHNIDSRLLQQLPDNPEFYIDKFIPADDPKSFITANKQKLINAFASSLKTHHADEQQLVSMRFKSNFDDANYEYPHLEGKEVMMLATECYTKIELPSFNEEGELEYQAKPLVSRAKIAVDISPAIENSKDITETIQNLRKAFAFALLQARIDEPARGFNSGSISPFTWTWDDGITNEPESLDKFISEDMQSFACTEKMYKISEAKQKAIKDDEDCIDSFGTYHSRNQEPLKIYYV